MERLLFLCLFSLLFVSASSAQIFVDQDNDVGINKSNPSNQKLYILNDNRIFSGYYLNTYPTSSNKYGVFNEMENGTGEMVGFYSKLRNDTGKKIGFYSSIEQIGSQGVYGAYHSITSNGTGNIVGTNNNLNINTANLFTYGTQNSITANEKSKFIYAQSAHVKIHDGPSNYYARGTYNDMRSYIDYSGRVVGIQNNIYGEGTGSWYGSRCIMNVNDNSDRIYGFDGAINKMNSHDEETYGIHTYTRLGPNSAGKNFGVKSIILEAGNANTNSSTDENYGIYSFVEDHLAGYSGYFSGKPVYIMGTTYNGSDERLKENIKDLNGSLDKLRMINPKSYNLTRRSKGENNLNYGFIAQQVKEVFPDLVTLVKQPGEVKSIQISKEEIIKNEDGTTTIIPAEYNNVQDMDGEPLHAINYDGFIALIVDALKEQDDKVASLKETVNTMQKTLADCGCGEKLGKSNNGLLEDMGYIQEKTPNYLTQKLQVKIYPNPTDRDATLEINAEESGIHQIHVYDEQGRLVHKDEIYVSSGTHQHEIASSGWSGGLYYVNTTYQGISKSLKLIVAGK